MKNILIYLFPIILFFSASCSNETDEIIEKELPPPIDYLIIDTVSTEYNFEENVNTIVKVALFEQRTDAHYLDINNDSIFDIEISCNYVEATFYESWSARILTLNDSTMIDVISFTDSIANYTLTHFDSDQNDSITITYTENYNHKKEYPLNMEIKTATNYYPKIHVVGDTLDIFNNWQKGSFILNYKFTAGGWSVTRRNKGIWSGIGNKMIGIKFLDNDQLYYGWIELSVNNYTISIHKYALKMIPPNGSN